MVAPAAYPCARCGKPLRWAAASSAWACDACRVTYPAQGAPVPAAAPRSRRALAPKQKILVVAGSVSGVALLGITLVLVMGGGKRAGKGTPEELFDAAIDRAVAGDRDGLFALSGMQVLFDSVMDCSDAEDRAREDHKRKDWRTELVDSQREEMTRHLEKWKGLTITVTSVEPNGDPYVQRTGVSMGGCTAKTDVTTQRFRVKAKVKGADGDERDAELRFNGAKVDGQWYLDDMPPAPLSGAIAKLRGIRDRMCACRDNACAQGVQKELEEFGKDIGESGTSTDDAAEQSSIINELTDCEVKAMSSGSPY